MKTEEKIELLEAVSELLHTEGHESVYDSSEATVFWDARTFLDRCIRRIRLHATGSEKKL
jgi:hypothetical protein